MLIELPTPAQHSDDRHALLDGHVRNLTSRLDGSVAAPMIAQARNAHVVIREQLRHLVYDVLLGGPPVEARIAWPSADLATKARGAGPIVWSEPCRHHARCVVVETEDGFIGDVPTSAIKIDAVDVLEEAGASH